MRDWLSAFGKVNTVIYGRADNLIRIEREVLSGLGITSAIHIDEEKELLGYYATNRPDFIIMNDDGTNRVQALTQKLRCEFNSPDPFVIVFMVTTDATVRRVRQAIFWGVDEVIGLPFRPIDFLNKLKRATFHRRDFVRVTNYFGPDRRRMNDDMPNGTDRREKDFEDARQIEFAPSLGVRAGINASS